MKLYGEGESLMAPTIDTMLPPQNLEAERKLLCECVLDNDAIDDIADKLKADDFYRDTHQVIWRAMVWMRNEGKPIDGVTLADTLIRYKQFDKVGGDDYLGEIMGSSPHSANARYHAEIIREKAVSRRLIQGATEIIREGYSNSFTSGELLDAAEKRIFAISEAEASGKTIGAAEHVGRTMTAIMNRRDRFRSGTFCGITSGLPDIDQIVGGFRPGELIIVAARPSIGKTALAIDFLRHVAKTDPVLFFSMEMGEIAIGDRIIAAEARVDTRRIQAGSITDKETDRLTEAAFRVQEWKYFLDDSSKRSITQIRANSRRTKLRHGLGMVVVDYLQLLDGERKDGDKRENEIAGISKGLKATARELNIPVIALSQLNRKSEDREDRRPRMADLRESGSIEQDADVVMLLHRPEFYEIDDEPGVAYVFIEKNRNGATGSAKLCYTKELTRFDSYSFQVPAFIPDDTEPF